MYLPQLLRAENSSLDTAVNDSLMCYVLLF